MGFGVAVKGEGDVALLFERGVGDVLHAGIGGGDVGAGRGVDGEGLTDDIFGLVVEARFREPHALGKLAEEPDVGAGFAGRLYGLL